jgi:hypothetical protein
LFLNAGIDWYPNANIKKLDNYNDWVWLGADLSLNFVEQADIPSDAEIEQKGSPRLSLAIEVGFSPWHDPIKGNKKFFFGIQQKFLSVYNTYDPNNNVKRRIYPSLYLGYEWNTFFISAFYRLYGDGGEVDGNGTLNLELGVSF